jgi:hypothetical protein
MIERGAQMAMLAIEMMKPTSTMGGSPWLGGA